MDKRMLEEYIDACELIKETENDIKKLQKKKKTVIKTGVSGSNPEFPYNPMHFHIEGTAMSYSDEAQLRYEEKLLEERRADAERIKLQVQQFLNTIPVRMQRIIRMKYFEGKSWETVAKTMGRKATEESVRKELDRFLKEN